MNTGKTLFAQIMDFLPWSTLSTGWLSLVSRRRPRLPAAASGGWPSPIVGGDAGDRRRQPGGLRFRFLISSTPARGRPTLDENPGPRRVSPVARSFIFLTRFLDGAGARYTRFLQIPNWPQARGLFLFVTEG